MKTAISVPDGLFKEADLLAKCMGVSRSELYAAAVQEYLVRHRQQDVTARLNEVYSQEPSGLAPELQAAQARSVDKAEW